MKNGKCYSEKNKHYTLHAISTQLKLPLPPLILQKQKPHVTLCIAMIFFTNFLTNKTTVMKTHKAEKLLIF